jgi:hypothetical protein
MKDDERRCYINPELERPRHDCRLRIRRGVCPEEILLVAFGLSNVGSSKRNYQMWRRASSSMHNRGWIAEVVEIPGALAYGATSDQAKAKAQAIALRALADQLDHGETTSDLSNISFAAA